MNNVTEHIEGQDLTLFINGNFDESTSLAIEKKIEEIVTMDKIQNICIDLGKVRYLSSAGIRVLMIAHKKGKKNNKQITLGEIPIKVKDVLVTVGILPLFSIRERV